MPVRRRVGTPEGWVRWAAVALLCAVGFAVLTVGVEVSWRPLTDTDHHVVDTLNGTAAHRRWLVDSLVAVSVVLHPTAFRLAAVVLVAALLLRAYRLATPPAGEAAAVRPDPPVATGQGSSQIATVATTGGVQQSAEEGRSGGEGRVGTVRLAVLVAVTVGGGGVLATAVKDATDRPRPQPPHPVATAAGLSFPSGHALGVTVATVVFAVVIQALTGRRVPRLYWPSAVAAGAVCGFARVGLGLHYPSDVLGGYLLGAAWAAAAVAAWHAVSPRRQVEPSADASPKINGSGSSGPGPGPGGGCRS
jgi:undecaprenyl-diphosphatase